MKSNPCRNCESAFIYKGRHSPGVKCSSECEKYRAHLKYLYSQRKFIPGAIICDMDTLMSQQYVFWKKHIDTKPKHIEVIKSLQYRIVEDSLKRGFFNMAVQKQEDE